VDGCQRTYAFVKPRWEKGKGTYDERDELYAVVFEGVGNLEAEVWVGGRRHAWRVRRESERGI
jgi:hypothetical protein